MRRRSFFQAAVAVAAATALTGRGAFAAAGEFENRLLALAATIVPGPDPNTWRGSAVVSALLAEMNDPGKQDLRKSYSAALEKLNDASGGDFSALKAQRRADVLKELISGDEEFGKKFAAIREDVMRVYFTSEAGMKFVGYRNCTQFEGYPEYFKSAKIWE